MSQKNFQRNIDLLKGKFKKNKVVFNEKREKKILLLKEKIKIRKKKRRDFEIF
jgi:hypothetical protein